MIMSSWYCYRNKCVYPIKITPLLENHLNRKLINDTNDWGKVGCFDTEFIKHCVDSCVTSMLIGCNDNFIPNDYD